MALARADTHSSQVGYVFAGIGSIAEHALYGRSLAFGLQ
jgi:hypothetical protein